MAGEGQHIDILLVDIDVEMTGGLHGVGMEQDTFFPADRADLRNGQDGADLVVGVHGGDQAGVGADGVRYLLGGDGADGAHRQQLDLKAFLFQLFQGVENGVVLKGGGDDVLFPLAETQPRGGEQGLVVGLAAAGGEGDLIGGGVQTLGDGLPRALQRLGGLLSHAVEAGGVAVDALHIGEHGVDGRLAHFRGGCVIGIDLHDLGSFPEGSG